MSNCYSSYRKPELLKTANFLLEQECCDEVGCSELADDLQDLQFKCNDIFGKINESYRDEKGNIAGSVCSKLQDKKILISNRFTGGKKRKRKTKRLKKTRKVIKKSRKYKRIKK